MSVELPIPLDQAINRLVADWDKELRITLTFDSNWSLELVSKDILGAALKTKHVESSSLDEGVRKLLDSPARRRP